MKAKVAFYKAFNNPHATLMDKLIAINDFGLYSHCELVIGDRWITSSGRDGGVRQKNIHCLPESWDFVEVDIDYKYVMDKFSETEGCLYDWLGVVGIALFEYFPFKIEDEDKWFCSEYVAMLLKLCSTKCYKISPNKLYKKLKD